MHRKLQRKNTQTQATSRAPQISELTETAISVSTGGGILLYNYSSYFNSDGDFTLYPSEFKWRKDGSLLIKKNKRLAFYKTEVDGKTDYNIEFKNMYTRENGFFYSIEGGVISIDAKYKSLSKKAI